jgi:hypothetical protein
MRCIFKVWIKIHINDTYASEFIIYWWDICKWIAYELDMQCMDEMHVNVMPMLVYQCMRITWYKVCIVGKCINTYLLNDVVMMLYMICTLMYNDGGVVTYWLYGETKLIVDGKHEDKGELFDVYMVISCWCIWLRCGYRRLVTKCGDVATDD